MTPWKILASPARPLQILAALTIVGCGGGKDDTDIEDPTGGCEFAGTTDGCIVFEQSECVPDASYSALDGGWYELRDDGSMMIQMAPNDEGIQIGFEILDASAIAATVEYLLPTEVILHLKDASGTEYQACAGKLTITSYTPDGTLWGKWSFKAKSVTGVCDEVDYYTSGGTFTNAEPCS